MHTQRTDSSDAVTARAPRRWAGLGASALVIAAVPLIPAMAPTAAADDCPDAEVVFARGTDEPAGMGRVGDALVDSLRKQAPELNIRSYAVNYKATITQRHGGDGAKDAISHIKSTADACPNTKIVLGGYSQGASVVNIVAGFNGVNWGDPLPAQYMNNVAAVATFGNVADRTGGAPPTQNSPLSAKAIDLCNPADPICHAGPGNAWSGHTQGYVPEYTDQAAAFVAAALLAGRSHSLPGYGSQLPSYGPQTEYGQLPGPATGYAPQAPQYGQLPDSQAPQYGQLPGPQQPGYGWDTPDYGPVLPGPAPSAPATSDPVPDAGSTLI